MDDIVVCTLCDAYVPRSKLVEHLQKTHKISMEHAPALENILEKNTGITTSVQISRIFNDSEIHNSLPYLILADAMRIKEKTGTSVEEYMDILNKIVIQLAGNLAKKPDQ